MADTDPTAPTHNFLGQLLGDLRDFVGLLANLVTDDKMSEAAFGFSVDIGFVTHLNVVVDALDAASKGEADLAQYAAAAARLAEVTDTVNLMVQAVQADLPPGVIAEEAVGLVLDTAGLTYVSSRWPALMAFARLLGMSVETFTLDGIGAAFSGAWASVAGPLENEDDARVRSRLLAAIGLTAAMSPLLVDKLFHRHIDPESLQVLHGWESDPTSTTPVADRISERFVTLLLHLKTGPDAAEVDFDVSLTLAFVPRTHGGPGLWSSIGLGAGGDFQLGSGWHLVVEGDLSDAIDVFLPSGSAEEEGFVSFGSAVGGKVEVRLERRDEGTGAKPAEPWRLGKVLEARAVELALTIKDREPYVELVARVRDGALAIPQPDSGFFRRLVPSGGLRADFDLGLILSSSAPHFAVEGGTGIEVMIPIRTSTPKMQGLHVYLALKGRPKDQTTGPALTFEASTGFGTRIGCFSASIDRFGVILPHAPHGLPGAPWLKLPNAIGIGIDGDVVKGGGFILFDPDKGHYAGVLTLTFGRWTVTAFGLLTDLPNGYSLLIVLSVQWDPPLAGPFGIFLVALGGVLGHNHGADVNALEASVRTGMVRTILFPPDPVAAAPRVLTTLGNVFPVTPGSSLLGFALELAWSGRLVTLVAAVIVESGPTPRVVILASIEAVAPTRELPLVRLRVDAVGIFDNRRPSVEIDGSLVSSFIGPLAVTGDMTFRLHGGDDSVFLLAVGGFHPSYTPPESANVPPQRRITLALPSDNPRVRFEAYFAVTSNSLQMGAKIEVSARAGGFSAEALIGFDALVQRNPFHLTVDIEGRAAIRYEGSTLASVGLDLHLDGPSPWRLHGKATLSLLFFSITIPINYSSGDDVSQVSVAKADPAAALSAALADRGNWEATDPIGGASLVALQSTVAAGELAAHPAGRLAVRQNVLPLGIALTHLGPAPVDPDRFDVASVVVNGTAVGSVADVRAPFAAGEFVDLSNDERLSRPAFEPFVAGFSAGGDRVTVGPATAADLTYEQIFIGPDGPLPDAPRRGPALAGIVAHGATLGFAATSPVRRDDLANRLRAAPLVTLSSATRVSVDAATLHPVVVPGLVPGATETELRQAVAAAGLTTVLVVGAHEAVPVGVL